MKILGFIGTRPQALKADPQLLDVVVNSGQHWDDAMDGQHLRDMKIRPKYNLRCTSEETGKMIDLLRPILRREKPDIVVVYGDTNTTAAGALAAAWENIPLAHIESGLRSGDTSMPEEVNRIIADRLATWKFCPSLAAYDNLLKENVGTQAFVVGDPLFDSLKKYVPVKARKDRRQYVFATIHRKENQTEEALKNILLAFKEYGERVVLPLHPGTHRIIKKLRLKVSKNVEVLKPLSRKETLEYITNAKLVVTDSGGIQREAYWIVIPALILRTVTEWPETVEDGWATLVGSNTERILDGLKNFKPSGAPMHVPKYGANEKIRFYLKEE